VQTRGTKSEKNEGATRLHATQKKKWELCQCRAVAEEINRLRGTDYEAVNYKEIYPQEDFPDVLLRSPSGSHPDLAVEVTSIPAGFLQRDDKHSDQRITETLRKLLSSKGVEHYDIGVGLSTEARAHGVKEALLRQLADLLFEVVSHHPGVAHRKVCFSEIHRHSPELAKYVTDVILLRYGSMPSVQVDVGIGQRLPSDDRWIEEGIRKKVESYGGRAVEKLMLVIGVAAFVDLEQIEAFRAAHPEESLPFSEIWIVTYYDRGVFCLKSKGRGPA
jgi:hypothetical protein